MYKELKPLHKGARIIQNNTCSFSSLFMKKSDAGYPIHVPVIKRGKGPYLYDYDENRYVDFELSRGSLLLGHAPSQITAIMKSWLTRGYASGYPVSAHQMLSSKLNGMVLGDEKREGAWLFYNSPFEASAAALSLLNLFCKKKRGIYLLPGPGEKRFSPFQSTCIERLDTCDIKGGALPDADFAVARPDPYCAGAVVDSFHKLLKKGVCIVSDETEFASHVHFRQNQNLLDDVHMRVFGSYLSSGISFGCIYVKNCDLFDKEKTMDYSGFRYVSTLAYGIPLYTMKAVIKYLSVLQKQGGIGGLLERSRMFHKMLNEEYFDLVDRIIYFRVSEKQKRGYSRLRLELLKSCLYFPLFSSDAINISYAHSKELLKESAERINLLFSDFYRKV